MTLTETIKMEIAANPEYVSVVRLTTSGIANKMGFCIDDIEDLKVAISEACTNAIKHSTENKFTIIYTVLEKELSIQIVDNGKGYDTNSISQPSIENLKESGMGLFIIESLMDEVSIESQEGKGTSIKMTKYLGVDI
ncbi:anti-sigma B factor RsbW [Terrisporobacter sp.]